MPRPKPLVLIILDGWGYRADTKANAIALARKPTYDRLLREYPNTLIHTSGPFVGLPEGQMGNSEVGHLNMGAGRIVHMDITRIDLMIRNGEFFSHPVLLAAMKNARSNGRKLHLFGLVSDGGVHSRQEHLYALLKMARQQEVDRVFVHAFTDGRDTLPTNGAGYLNNCSRKCASTIPARSPPLAAATTPWIATAAGSASRKLTPPWSRLKPKVESTPMPCTV
jgi:2,3-bisphosphoglycerate-independent phosphoglycerate mutase